jgi:outer membrane protein OmpA-like peptidoglycan-associated protein
MNVRFNISLFVLLLIFSLLVAQEHTFTSASSRAVRYYQQAESHFIRGNMPEAERLLMRAVNSDGRFIEAWLLLGDVYGEQDKMQEARHAFEQAVAIDEKFFPPALFFLTRLAHEALDYDDAALFAVRFLSHTPINEEMRARAQDIYNRSVFAIWALANPVPFEPVNLGESVNDRADEYINAIRLDDSLMFFTRRFEQPGFEFHGRYNENFFVSTRSTAGWQKAAQLQLNWPQTDNMGALTISADGRTMFFAACGWPDGYGSCDIYTSRFSEGSWSLPKNLGSHINSSNWESQPSVSADGRELFFVRRRSGGRGGSDIWMSNRLDDGKWSPPINLGEQINTSGSEMAPFIHPDGKTLYFSSDGHIGMGGSDLFVSRRDETGRWHEPQNLGYPINTSGDEINIIVTAQGDKAYISSQREGGFGGYDIYEFELNAESRPNPVSWISALVNDAESGKPLQAEYSLINLEESVSTHHGATSLPEGSMLISLPTGKNYALHIRKDGYLFFSQNFQLTNETESKPYLIHAHLQPVKEGSATVLNNVFFDTDSSRLRADSYSELDVLAEFLLNNPALIVELAGHTDSTGQPEYNLQLSLERAASARAFLVQKGVPEQQVRVKGYGDTKPVAANETEEGRALNRRTELIILGLLE